MNLNTIENYTLTQCKEDCIKLWDYLRKTGKYKKESLESLNNSVPNCACCKFVERIARSCDYCPINWGSSPKQILCLDLPSPYAKWTKAESIKARKIWATEVLKLALQIRP